MWRYGPPGGRLRRRKLPAQLLSPIRAVFPAEPVWDDPLNQDLMPHVFVAVVLGETLYIGFNDRDKVVALDTRTGAQSGLFSPTDRSVSLWPEEAIASISPATGRLPLLPVRTPETCTGNSAATPRTRSWQQKADFHVARAGGASSMRTRFISTSIWPFMGTFIYAWTRRPAIIWRKEGTGADYQNQPHNSPAFAGVAPRARSSPSRPATHTRRTYVPALFRPPHGELLYYHLENTTRPGGAFSGRG